MTFSDDILVTEDGYSLIYSPDDGGWYWENEDWVTSITYPTQEEAIEAYIAKNIDWHVTL